MIKFPAPLSAYMAACLYDPKQGFYTTQNPLGKAGHFITAPEITQIFGEMVGLWIYLQWQSLGGVSLHLIELGPGRGTLMSDALRALKGVPELLQNLRLTLVEVNPVLKQAQAEALKNHSPQWVENLKEVTPDGPTLIIGNEFLDCFPINQYIVQNGQWHHRWVGHTPEGVGFILGPQAEMDLLPAPQGEGQIFEQAPSLTPFVQDVKATLAGQGKALFFDYGYLESPGSPTFQAVQDHAYANPFEAPGKRDLTALVDFGAVKAACTREGLTCKVKPQQAFLQEWGYQTRVEALAKTLVGRDQEDFLTRTHRVLHHMPEFYACEVLS